MHAPETTAHGTTGARTTETIRWERDDDGIVTLTLDDPSQSANTMRAQFADDIATVVDRLEALVQDRPDEITGVIVTSAKKTFFAGGDLNELIAATPDDAPAFSAGVERMHRTLRRLETLGRPVVAAINGAALGGGLEIALACHHRVAMANPTTRIGLPEVTLGLLPGGGGVVRITRMLGVVEGMLHVLGQGQQHPLTRALELGLVDEVVDDRDEMLAAARAWIAANPEAIQPWDRDGYCVPGGLPSSRGFMAVAPALPANLRKQTRGAHHDAPHHILAAAVESLQVPIDRAWEIERRYFVDLVCNSQQAKNMTQAFFFDLQAINRGSSRPEGFEVRHATRVAVLGAGMMGAGIAYVCAKAGIDVVLLDTDLERAEHGKAYSEGLVAKGIERGRVSEASAQALLDRITPGSLDDAVSSGAGSADGLAGCDLVIEAVFEDTALKHEVLAKVERAVDGDALLASNTSTIPITTLAEGVRRREDFVGLHFFSPVDRMPLVEIIAGEQTSDAALARAVDVVQQIRKTPIVVSDSRGFFTSRVIGTFLNEAVAMVGEGVDPVRIERAGEMAGYPAAPLQLMDELSLTLSRRIEAEYAAAADEGYERHPAFEVIDRLVEEFGREGKAAGAGFYEYADGERVGLWDGLTEAFGGGVDQGGVDQGGVDQGGVDQGGVDQGGVDQGGVAAIDTAVPFEDVKERMLFAEAIETVRCLDEGVLRSFEDANIGSILGIGFPAWTGGVAQYVDQYPGGTTGFVARCKELADRYGQRFVPPESLVARAESGEPLRSRN